MGVGLPPRRGTYRLGVFGSMMNPPHLGHVAIVEAVYAATPLDRIVVVPAGGLPPHRAAPSVSARARLMMAVRAFADLDHVVVSDSEVERAEDGDIGYMVDTIAELYELPGLIGYDDLTVNASLIVGADQAATLGTWHRFGDLSAQARIIVVGRPDQVADEQLAASLDELRDQWGIEPQLVEMSPVAISSTRVREVAATGDRSLLATMVPAAIIEDVLRLYGPRSGA